MKWLNRCCDSVMIEGTMIVGHKSVTKNFCFFFKNHNFERPKIKGHPFWASKDIKAWVVQTKKIYIVWLDLFILWLMFFEEIYVFKNDFPLYFAIDHLSTPLRGFISWVISKNSIGQQNIIFLYNDFTNKMLCKREKSKHKTLFYDNRG